MRNKQSTFRRENDLSISFRVVLNQKNNNNKRERKLQKTLSFLLIFVCIFPDFPSKQTERETYRNTSQQLSIP